jgi:hypothetical protein
VDFSQRAFGAPYSGKELLSYLDLFAEFYDKLDPTRLRLKRPSPFIFLCGGPVNLEEPTSPNFLSLRDLIYRSTPGLKHRLVLAEEAQELFIDSGYSHLVEFEAHIAQIAELVLLICESPGSLAELGAFAVHPQIAERLYAIYHTKYAGERSFIMLGPLRLLTQLSSDAVGGYDWAEKDRIVDPSSVNLAGARSAYQLKDRKKPLGWRAI